MPYYRCTVAGITGKKTQVVTRAGSEEELLESYAGSGVFLLGYEAAEGTEDRGSRRRRFSRGTVREFTLMMASLLKGGTTAAAALELCKRAGSGDGEGGVGRLCGTLLEGIRRGETFAQSLVRCAPEFSPLYRAMVGIGEKTGKTAEVLSRLSTYLTTSQRIRSKTAGALVYPVFVLVLGLAGSVLVLLFVMPRMAEIFAVFNAGGSTVIDMGGMYTTVYVAAGVSILCALSGALTVVFHRVSAQAALALDTLALGLPFVGPFLTVLASLDLSFALELCTASGMNAELSLKEAEQVVRNRYYARSVEEVRAAVSAWKRLSQAFDRKPFPAVMSRWAAVGEETGEGGAIFARLSSFFGETVEYTTERFLNALEPALILVTGLVILALVIQFVLPLFALYGAAL